MGKIRLESGQELNIIADGISTVGNTLILQIEAGQYSIQELDNIFTDRKNTGKIWVIDYTGELFECYTGFTELRSVAKEYDVVVRYSETKNGEKEAVKDVAIRVCLERPDETKQRIAALEETVDTLVLESLGK